MPAARRFSDAALFVPAHLRRAEHQQAQNSDALADLLGFPGSEQARAGQQPFSKGQAGTGLDESSSLMLDKLINDMNSVRGL